MEHFLMVWHACYSMFFTVSGALSLTWPSVTFMPTNHLHSLKALEGCQQGDAALWAPINPWCHIRQMSLRVGEAESAWTSLLPVLSSAHIWLIIYMLQNYLSLVSVEVFESNSPNFSLAPGCMVILRSNNGHRHLLVSKRFVTSL